MKNARTAAALTTATLALLAISGCGGPSAASTPATFTAKGTLRDQTVPRWGTGENCDSGQYGQLKQGFEVKIEAKGSTVAMGTLKKHGVMAAQSSSGYFCDYELSIDGVPAGLGFYTVDLGDKLGHKEFSEKVLTDGNMSVETSTFDGFK